MRENSRSHEDGQLIVNAMIWLTVTVLILAVAFPAAGKIREDRRAASLIDTTQKLETACRMYHADTGAYAIEFSPSRSGQYSSPRYHQLSMSQDVRGWRGPYLDQPLSTEDNPFGGAIYLQDNLNTDPAKGFRLQADQSTRSEGPGQFVVYYGVPEVIAVAVDGRFDGKPEYSTKDQNWRNSGRVEWQKGGGGALIIKLNITRAKGKLN